MAAGIIYGIGFMNTRAVVMMLFWCICAAGIPVDRLLTYTRARIPGSKANWGSEDTTEKLIAFNPMNTVDLGELSS